MKSYRDLLVWQRSMELAVACHDITRRVPSTKVSGLVGQVQRAAASVPANIAEGAGRRSRADYLRHLSIANGSLLELETHLMLGARIGVLPDSEIAGALVLSGEVGRMLAGLIRRLRDTSRGEPDAG